MDNTVGAILRETKGRHEAVELLENLYPRPFYPPAMLEPDVHFALDLLVANGEATWSAEGYLLVRKAAR